jgi:hypothetical protein
MAKSALDADWLPRIGEQATAQLRGVRHAAVIGGPAVVALAVVASFCFANGAISDVCLGVVAVAVAVGLFTRVIRRQMRLAEALSQLFATKIGWAELPNMRPAQFDAWRERRGLQSPNERRQRGE